MSDVDLDVLRGEAFEAKVAEMEEAGPLAGESDDQFKIRVEAEAADAADAVGREGEDDREAAAEAREAEEASVAASEEASGHRAGRGVGKGESEESEDSGGGGAPSYTELLALNQKLHGEIGSLKANAERERRRSESAAAPAAAARPSASVKAALESDKLLGGDEFKEVEREYPEVAKAIKAAFTKLPEALRLDAAVEVPAQSGGGMTDEQSRQLQLLNILQVNPRFADYRDSDEFFLFNQRTTPADPELLALAESDDPKDIREYFARFEKAYPQHGGGGGGEAKPSGGGRRVATGIRWRKDPSGSSRPTRSSGGGVGSSSGTTEQEAMDKAYNETLDQLGM